MLFIGRTIESNDREELGCDQGTRATARLTTIAQALSGP